MTPRTTLPHVGIDDVRAAAERIAPYAHRTPVVASKTLNDELGLEVFFKCENLQKVGAFKARGALNAVLGLSEEDAARGVITHSSGNHGQALAYAASQRGIPCTVVMPDHAPAVKVDAVRGYGANVVLRPHEQRHAATSAIQAETGAELIHPFNDTRIIAGQGTAALELFDELGALDAIVAPIGGGGLLSGTSVTTRAVSPTTQLIGAEPERVDDAARSMATGVRQPAVPNPDTVADGLLTGLGELTFDVLLAAGVRVVTVSESEILAAARFHLERMKLVVEPSGATPLAAIRQIAPELRGARVGAIVSGGNTDFSWLD